MQSPSLHSDFHIYRNKRTNEEQERKVDIVEAEIEIENVKMSSKVVAGGWF